MRFLVNLVSLYTAQNNKIKLLSQLSKKVLVNETIVISNREVFDYGHIGSTNGKSIINFKINKIEKNSRQAKKTSVSLILINNILVSDTKLSLIVIDMLIEKRRQCSKVKTIP